MNIKIEYQVGNQKIPGKTEQIIKSIVESVPREHLRGVERIKIVEAIEDPRLKTGEFKRVPALYHPKQGSQRAWFEVALNQLLPPQSALHKKLFQRLSFKSNLATIIFSLIGQHYYLTMRHSIKKTQLETAIRSYVEKQMKLWGAKEHKVRARLFKPLQPLMERWARNLQRRAKNEMKKAS